MQTKKITNSYLSKEKAITHWKESPFFTQKVVLGLDIGIEGIGIAVRKGKDLLYCKSLKVDLPISKRLAKRRASRAGRRARKNRRLRMRRLKQLFAKYKLPWVSNEIMERSDPFILRQRAIDTTKGGLKSKKALSICIRYLVAHRGYDFYSLMSEEGSYPWGDSPELSTAKKWLSSTFVDEEIAQQLRDLSDDLVKKDKLLEQKDIESWEDAIANRLKWSQDNSIKSMLDEYAKNKSNYRRARGYNYPRTQIEKHLKEIICRHKNLMKPSQAQAFMDELFAPNNKPADKKVTIFHYNRKVRSECEALWTKKIRHCIFSEELGLGDQLASPRNDPSVWRWSLLDFLSNRHFFLTKNGLIEKRRLPEECIKFLINKLEGVASGTKLEWKKIEKELILKLGELNYQLDQKASTKKSKIKNEAKTSRSDSKEPQAQEEVNPNKSVLTQLKDILCPSGQNKNRAKLSSQAAEELYKRVTHDGKNFDPLLIEEHKKELSYYEILQRHVLDYGIYPQVQTLLGTLRREPKEGQSLFGTTGFLQKLFEKELAPSLKGKKHPDYCIIECIKDPPYNQKEQKKRANENEQARSFNEQLIKDFGISDASPKEMIRLKLYYQQGGRAKDGRILQEAKCPFTGQSLGKDPLSSDLDLAHLFPNSKGGEAIAANLVLTTSLVNKAMQNYTPRQVAKLNPSLPKGLHWLSWEEMLALNKGFHWNDFKRQLFAFTSTPDQQIPDFGQLTRTAQLARQLRRMVCLWMGIENKPKEILERIGNPSGLHTAAARRGWNLGTKDRTLFIHHREDAALLSFIPPGPGINLYSFGGIFENYRETYTKGQRTFTLEKLRTLEELNPDIQQLITSSDKGTCPVVLIQSKSRGKPLGDSTFYQVQENGDTFQRYLALPTPNDMDEKYDAEKLFEDLLKNGIEESLIPSERELTRWIQNPLAPFKLRNGKTLRHLIKTGKGKIQKKESEKMGFNPLGWSGVVRPNGKIDQLRKLDKAYSRLELWLGWNAKKGIWEYYRRVIPSSESMEGLRRLGIPWGKPYHTDKLPKAFLLFLKVSKCQSLKEYYSDALPSFSHKVGEFKLGDLFCFEPSSQRQSQQESQATVFNSTESESIIPQPEWYKVSAIKTTMQIECTPVVNKILEKKQPSSAAQFAQLLRLPEVKELAKKKGLRPH